MIENGNLLEVVDKKKTFRGLCVFCLFASDEYGKISIPVYASDFPVQHLKMLVGASFELSLSLIFRNTNQNNPRKYQPYKKNPKSDETVVNN